MNKKLKGRIMPIIIIILLIVILFLIFRKPTEINISNNSNPIKIEDKSNKINEDDPWDKLSSEELVSIVSNLAPSDLYFSKEDGLIISEKVDLTGDGKTEAVVSGVGYNNGVTFILTKDTDGNIVLAKQKYNNDISPVYLVTIGRAMVNESFRLAPSDNAFYTVSLELDQSADNSELESVFKCGGVDAYSWNNKTSLFEQDKVLTDKYTKEICK